MSILDSTSTLLPAQGTFNDEQTRYLEDALQSIQRGQNTASEGFNGDFKNSVEVEDGLQWIPILKGASTDGVGTYTQQSGWAYRQGLMVDVFFDIAYSAHTGTGGIYIELPYKVAKAIDTVSPFVGSVITSQINFSSGSSASLLLRENTFQCELWEYGSGVGTAIINFPNTGRIIGTARYIGQSYE